MNKLFSEPGKKIKGIAKTAYIIECIAAVISGIYLMIEYEILYGILTIIGGILGAYLLTIFAYAFGELVESNSESKEHLANLYHNTEITSKTILQKAAPTATEAAKAPHATKPAKQKTAEPKTAEQNPAQTAKDTVKSEPKTAEEILRYALNFTTAQGARNYLTRQVGEHPEFRDTIDWVLCAPDSTLWDSISEYLEENDGSVE